MRANREGDSESLHYRNWVWINCTNPRVKQKESSDSFNCVSIKTQQLISNIRSQKMHRHAQLLQQEPLGGALEYNPPPCNCSWEPTGTANFPSSFSRYISNKLTDPPTLLMAGGTRQTRTPPKWLRVAVRAVLTAETEVEVSLPTSLKASNTT